MGKSKRKHLASGPKGNKQKFTGKGAKPTGISKSQAPQKKKKHMQEAHKRPTIPFSPSDRVLLIGEGDLSFARSLLEHHRRVDLTATTLESREELLDKYPTAAENIEKVEEGGGQVRYGVDAMKPVGGIWKELRGKVDRVVFNFPHVGGKTKDVNRQVRYNQELLVSFFTASIPLLAPHGSIIVTLFEGEPYTLWNIRDLGRHAGLQVEKSFKFQAGAYPGYRHSRTLGVVKNRDGKEGGWKGEERESRSYVFVRKGEGASNGAENGHGKKKGSDSESSDSEYEGEGGGQWGEQFIDEDEDDKDGSEEDDSEEKSNSAERDWDIHDPNNPMGENEINEVDSDWSGITDSDENDPEQGND